MVTAKAPGPALLVFTTNSHAVPGGYREHMRSRWMAKQTELITLVLFRGAVYYLWCLPPVLGHRLIPYQDLQPGQSPQHES